MDGGLLQLKTGNSNLKKQPIEEEHDLQTSSFELHLSTLQQMHQFGALAEE